MARNSVRQDNDSLEKGSSPPTVPRPRIETQIHRRSKAKAVFPLKAEWQAGADHPVDLKMPAEKMDKRRHVGS
jgi:hypothetical protein